MKTRYEVSRLANGLTVATAAQPHMASVTAGLWITVGGRYESARFNGACHFIEHMAFKGTGRRTALAISQEVEGLGGYLNAFTGEESTCYYARAPYQRLEPLLEVLVDMLLRSRFAPADIAKERGVIKEEIAMYLDQPSQHVQELLNELMWPDHPLGRPLAGTTPVLDKLNRAALLEFHREYYLASTAMVVAAGNVTHQQVVQAVLPHARHFRAGEAPACEPYTAVQTKPRLLWCTKSTEQTQMALGIRVCHRHDERRFALRLLSTLLGEIMSSRLFQVIREDHGLAYSISSTLSLLEDTGVLNVSAGLDTGNLPRVLRLVLRELRRLTERAPSRAELRRTRDYVISQLELSFDSTESQMNLVGDHWVGYRRVVSPAETKRRLAAVTPAQVRQCARDFFRAENLNLAVISPQRDSGRLLRELRF